MLKFRPQIGKKFGLVVFRQRTIFFVRQRFDWKEDVTEKICFWLKTVFCFFRDLLMEICFYFWSKGFFIIQSEGEKHIEIKKPQWIGILKRGDWLIPGFFSLPLFLSLPLSHTHHTHTHNTLSLSLCVGKMYSRNVFSRRIDFWIYFYNLLLFIHRHRFERNHSTSKFWHLGGKNFQNFVSSYSPSLLNFLRNHFYEKTQLITFVQTKGL